jgi:hypothetical protein
MMEVTIAGEADLANCIARRKQRFVNAFSNLVATVSPFGVGPCVSL